MVSAIWALPSASSGFDVGGLPLHPLVVHAVVVLLPLSAAGLIGCLLRPSWRERFGAQVLLGLVVSTVAAFVAEWSGESLAAAVGSPGQHQVWGSRVPWIALALLLLGGGWLVLTLRDARRAAAQSARQKQQARAAARRAKQSPQGSTPGQATEAPTTRPAWSTIALEAAAAMVAVAAIGVVVVTGHTGATATWAGRSGSTNAGSTPTPSATNGGYTMAQVAEHATAASCWSAINGDVYDLTSWIGQHPGGPNAIRSICGQDGSAGFNNRHATTPEALQTLPTFKIGTLLR